MLSQILPAGGIEAQVRTAGPDGIPTGDAGGLVAAAESGGCERGGVTVGVAQSMDRFVSTYRNKIDAKGRVSVPASFRSVIAKGGFDGVFCYPSLDAPAIDAGGQPLVDRVAALLEGLDPYSDERDHLSVALFGQSEIVKLDQEGRAILSEALRGHAEIRDQVVFVGLGDKFQIWEPGNFEAHLAVAREKVREQRRLLGTGGNRAPQGETA